jgi:hypothetical protein
MVKRLPLAPASPVWSVTPGYGINRMMAALDGGKPPATPTELPNRLMPISCSCISCILETLAACTAVPHTKRSPYQNQRTWPSAAPREALSRKQEWHLGEHRVASRSHWHGHGQFVPIDVLGCLARGGPSSSSSNPKHSCNHVVPIETCGVRHPGSSSNE